MAEEDQVIQISPQEEKGLRRAFDRLCDFNQKESPSEDDSALAAAPTTCDDKGYTFSQQFLGNFKWIRKEIQSLRAILEKTCSASTQPKQPKVLANDAQSKAEEGRLKSDIRNLEQEVARLENDPDKKIKAVDVWEHMKFLGKKCSKKEVTDMVWEVDENLDGAVDCRDIVFDRRSWLFYEVRHRDEFRLMFFRNINDQTGLEPAKLYNMVQFMLYDVDNNINVSVDETMNMLYARYGRTKMEAKLKELFGDDMRETGTQGGEMDFLKYLEAVERTQLNTYAQSPAGRVQLAKTGRKMKP